MTQAELHLAAEAEEDRLLAERADAEVSAIHEQQQLESEPLNLPSNAHAGDDSAANTPTHPAPHLSNTRAATGDSAPTSYVSAGLSFAVDCLGDEWAPVDESAQQRQERHVKRAGIIKIMELDSQLCAVRQRHRVITRTLACGSGNGSAASPSKRRPSSSASSTLFSDTEKRLHQRLQRAAEMCKNIEAPQLVRRSSVANALVVSRDCEHR
jgi:hypothetical protein